MTTVFTIVESLQRSDGVRISELAAELDLAKSTVHRHLSTLEELEYVVKEGDVYYLGLRFIGLGEFVRNRKLAFRLARDKVADLAEETEERAQFIAEEHGLGVCVHRSIGKRAVKADLEVGKRVPLHATASGKAILAHLPDRKRDRILTRRGLESYTDNTYTNQSELESHLDEIRDSGVAINEQEHIRGLKAIGVPVMGPDGDVLGAISVSGPAHRMKGTWLEDTLPSLLLGTANELELNIVYS